MVSQYLMECVYRGLATSTVLQYQWALARLKAQHSEVPQSGVQLLTVVGDTGLGMESRRDLVRCLRAFFRWCGRRYGLPNPCLELDPLPRRRILPRVLTECEVADLVCAVDNPRDEALVLLILDSGLRVGEVAGLKRRDLGDGWVVVRGKVGARQVPICPLLEQKLEVLGEGDYIWVGKRGPIGIRGLVQVYRRLFYKAGINGPKRGPHTLRHTFATMYLRGGGGIRQLQQIMGHTRIETTMIYVHLAGNDVIKDHALHSPIKTLGLLGATS